MKQKAKGAETRLNYLLKSLDVVSKLLVIVKALRHWGG